MDKIFEIKFPKSNSKNYKSALSLASSFTDFTPINEESNLNIIRSDSDEVFNRFKTLERLFPLILGWKGTIITYKGQEIRPFNFFQQFNNVIRCSRDYDNSISKGTFCNQSSEYEGWGCKFLTDIKRHISSEGYYSSKFWYNYGSFQTEDVWFINKNLLISELQREAENKRVVHCPIFNLEKIKKIADQLPDKIELKDSNDWEIIYKEDFFGTTIQRKPIGIKHLTKEKEPTRSLSFGINLGGLLNSEEKEENDTRIRYIPDTTFEDIGGIDQIIEKIREVIELPLKRPELYQHLGVKPHKGILLYGEPGNGKTLIAKAIANEVKAHFIPINGTELLSKWHGQSEENLRNIFYEARDLQPSIIFFDEIDSITQKRSGDENARLDAKFVNQLLTLMDGMETYENVTVLASTNRPELLDEALLRPGRFDYKIEIQKPNEVGCLKILKIATKKMPLDSTVKLEDFVPKLIGCSGAEIAFIAKESAMIAINRSLNVMKLITEDSTEKLDLEKIKVIPSDFEKALEKLNINKIH